MPCAPWGLVSACVLLMCAALAQAVQGYPDATSVSFLCMGVTSVIHHSRLDEWWKWDAWRWVDYIAIALFVTASISRFFSMQWLAIGAMVLALAAGIWSGCVPHAKIPCVHAVMHTLVAVSVLVAIMKDSTVHKL